MFVRNLFFFLGILLFISGCGGTTGATDSGLKLNGLGYVEVGTSNSLTHAGTSVSGDGKIRFSAPMPGGQGNKVDFDFLLADGGALILVMNTRADLGSGINIELQRTGNTLSRAHITSNVGAPTTFLPVIQLKPEFDASKPMSLKVRVHNNESPAHIIIMNKAGSEEYHEDETSHQGDTTNAFFGFDLRNATVAGVAVAADKD